MSDPSAATTFQWLVERGQPENHEPTVWLENSAEHPASHKHWTTDAWSAAMFPTRETAEAYIAEEHLEARAVEHGFMAHEDNAVVFDRPPSYLSGFEVHAAPEAIKAHIDKARKRSLEIQNEIGWLEGLYLRRVAEKAAGRWPA